MSNTLRVKIMAALLNLYSFLTSFRLIFLISPLIYLLYLFICRAIYEFRLKERFDKLPKLPTAGIAGLLLGNVDAYYYAMSHLPIPQGMIILFNFKNK